MEVNQVSIVLVGDWNRYYTQPQWVSDNVFIDKQMKISVEGSGIQCVVKYLCDSITLTANTDKFIFSIDSGDLSQISQLFEAVNSFVRNSFSPDFRAFGINVDYYSIEEKDIIIANNYFTQCNDVSLFETNDFLLITSSIKRCFIKNGTEYNINFAKEINGVSLKINRHHAVGQSEWKPLVSESISDYLSDCKLILNIFGY